MKNKKLRKPRAPIAPTAAHFKAINDLDLHWHLKVWTEQERQRRNA